IEFRVLKRKCGLTCIRSACSLALVSLASNSAARRSRSCELRKFVIAWQTTTKDPETRTSRAAPRPKNTPSALEAPSGRSEGGGEGESQATVRKAARLAPTSRRQASK